MGCWPHLFLPWHLAANMSNFDWNGFVHDAILETMWMRYYYGIELHFRLLYDAMTERVDSVLGSHTPLNIEYRYDNHRVLITFESLMIIFRYKTWNITYRLLINLEIPITIVYILRRELSRGRIICFNGGIIMLVCTFHILL